MIRMELASRLKFFRERAGLTIYEAGEKVGRSGKTISAWENGRGQPDADMLLTLCNLYSIDSISDLYGERAAASACSFDGLPDDLRFLFTVYESMNGEGREELVNYAKYISAQNKYKKVGSPVLVEGAQ